jgi:hypothetical protein
MISQLSTALEPSLAQVASSSIRFVFATFHGQDRFGRNSYSRKVLAVPAEETLEEWLVRFEDLAVQDGKMHHLRDVAIAYRFDGMEKKPTFWEYVQNFWQPVFGLRFVDIEPAWKS